MATPEMVQSFVAAARDYVKRATGVELDGSPESLAFVDHYIEQSRANAMAEDVLGLAAAALGAYFGELVIAHFGGRWELSGEPRSWRVVLEVGALAIAPVGMAAEALRQGAVAGYDASFSTRPEWMAPLAASLAAAPPVDQDYYYSLTGRFETLEHAADFLTALAEQERG
jgi:hypothetical protein